MPSVNEGVSLVAGREGVALPSSRPSGRVLKRLVLAEVTLSAPRATLTGSSVTVVCAWLFLDFVATELATILFAFIVFGIVGLGVFVYQSGYRDWLI